MLTSRLLAAVGIATAAVLSPMAAPAATLYDASLGTSPGAQGWLSLTPPFSSATVANGAYTVDTTALDALLAGSSRTSPFSLDSATGFELSITLQVNAEAHTSANRAGFSLIAISHDPTKSIELAFWQDRVFAYQYDGLDADRFVHGPEYFLDTTDALHSYRLRVQNHLYSLFIDDVFAFGNLPLVDYTPFVSPLDVYETPDFLFFGDDTTRGASRVSVASISLTPVPLPAALPLLMSALFGLGLLQRMQRPLPSH